MEHRDAESAGCCSWLCTVSMQGSKLFKSLVFRTAVYDTDNLSVVLFNDNLKTVRAISPDFPPKRILSPRAWPQSAMGGSQESTLEPSFSNGADKNLASVMALV